ncbi:MAG: nicotinate (nicotinamide) nucleotide adenylyltransferase [Scytolyngbya sp. HA4215-MV1]|jgi:nicotinate-nucleotide adenylyltransferase|nr:nicotinate (nicotinamide) nucleotide adenylyltransferase [Scytolyngbya sp. HA4215-MV1]
MQKKIAIFGGTFNPVHWGHLLIAETALHQCSLDQVLWVPTFHPPHKTAALPAFEHRLTMVQRAIADHPNFACSTIEAQHSGTSYAIDTLQDLQTQQPNIRWFWIVGLDAFQTLPRWHNAPELIAQCDWLVAPRMKSPASQGLGDERLQQGGDQLVRSLPLRWQILQMPLMEISSSLVRQHCRERRSIRYLVPETVRHYILTHQLYQT